MNLSDWDKEVLANMKCDKCGMKSMEMEIVDSEGIKMTWFVCRSCQTVFYNNGWDLREMKENEK